MYLFKSLHLRHFSYYLLICSTEVWKDMRVSRWWQVFHFWVNYPFKCCFIITIGSSECFESGFSTLHLYADGQMKWTTRLKKRKETLFKREGVCVDWRVMELCWWKSLPQVWFWSLPAQSVDGGSSSSSSLFSYLTVRQMLFFPLFSSLSHSWSFMVT